MSATATRPAHGHRGTRNGDRSPTYNSWRAMVERCTRERHPFFPDYGGRGIRVCDDWRTFAGFLADMGERPAGHTLDRIDPDDHYRPENCRWSTPLQQRWNRRDMIERASYPDAPAELFDPGPRVLDGIPF